MHANAHFSSNYSLQVYSASKIFHIWKPNSWLRVGVQETLLPAICQLERENRTQMVPCRYLELMKNSYGEMSLLNMLSKDF